MGACYSTPASAGELARADPELREIALAKDSPVSRVGLASASLAYSLLTTNNDGVVFLDARGKAAHDKSHIFGAKCIDFETLKAAIAADEKDGPQVALRARCSLRSVVICGSGGQPASLREEGVLEALRMLELVKARPRAQPLVLKGGMAAFAKRFAFCLRPAGGEAKAPLPACPAELMGPLPGKERGLLYVGVERCVQEPGTERVLAALGIKTILSFGTQGLQPPKVKGCRVVKVQAAKDDAVSLAMAAQEKLAGQTPPCLLCGPIAALAAALVVAEAMPSALPSAEAVEAYVKLRLPWAEFDTRAQAAISRAVAKARGDRELPQLLDPADIVPVVDGVGTPRGVADAASTVVEDTCTKFLRRDRRKAEVSLETVRRALTHVVDHPAEPKYRRLKGDNARVKREILANEEAVRLLRCCGWIADGEDLILPSTMPLERLRDVLSQMPGAAKSSATK